MHITTAFSCGDKAWAFNGARAEQLTVGQVRVSVTDSTGVNDGRVEPNCGIQFDNYKPQQSRVEEYMCIETGIGSGSVYTLGKHIFATQEECEAAHAESLAQVEQEKRERVERQRRELLAREDYLRAELARIDAAKQVAA